MLTRRTCGELIATATCNSRHARELSVSVSEEPAADDGADEDDDDDDADKGTMARAKISSLQPIN